MGYVPVPEGVDKADPSRLLVAFGSSFSTSKVLPGAQRLALKPRLPGASHTCLVRPPIHKEAVLLSSEFLQGNAGAI